MKKNYIIPITELYAVIQQENILQGTTTRAIDGGPTDNGGLELPTMVGSADAETDPYAGHGVGNNGAGNRSNTGLWED